MRDIIAAGLAELGLAGRVPDQAPEQLAEYGRLLLEKNRVMNLTAIREPDQAARLHMLDCAALAALTDLEGRSLIDVGSGAGFPGLPLKILVPSLEVTLLDSLNKRVDWLNEVIGALGLSGIRAVHARAEEQALVPGFRDSFDFAAARGGRPAAAVRAVPALCEAGGKIPGHEVHRQRPGAGGGRPGHPRPGRGAGGREGLSRSRGRGHPPAHRPGKTRSHPQGLPPPVDQDPKGAPVGGNLPETVNFFQKPREKG